MNNNKLIRLINDEDLEVLELPMESKIKGIYADNVIAINKYIKTNIEKACVLAEELGHYYTTSGNILDQAKIENRKQEIKARRWAYEKLVPLEALIEAYYYYAGIQNHYELAEFLEVTEEFLEEAISYYKDKYGLYYEIERYLIYFEPLGVIEKFFLPLKANACSQKEVKL